MRPTRTAANGLLMARGKPPQGSSAAGAGTGSAEQRGRDDDRWIPAPPESAQPSRRPASASGKDPAAATDRRTNPPRPPGGSGTALRTWRASACRSCRSLALPRAIIIVLSPLTTSKPIQPGLPTRRTRAARGAFGPRRTGRRSRHSTLRRHARDGRALRFGCLAVGLAFRRPLQHRRRRPVPRRRVFAAVRGRVFAQLDTNLRSRCAHDRRHRGSGLRFIPASSRRARRHEVVTTIMNAIARSCSPGLDSSGRGLLLPEEPATSARDAAGPVRLNIHLGVLLRCLAI